MIAIFKWFQRRWWDMRYFVMYRRHARAAKAQQEQFYEWAEQPSPDLPKDLWEVAQAQVDYDLSHPRRRPSWPFS